MEEKRLKELIQEGESAEVEFKESLSLSEPIGKTISSFSNANGGTLIIGVTDSEEIKGVELGENTLEQLANRIKQHTDPKIYPSISTVNLNGNDVVIIEVKESLEKPVFYRGSAYKRVGKSTHKLKSSEIRNLAKNSGRKFQWDEQICEEASLDDIDEEKVRQFLQTARNKRDLDIDPDISMEEALERLNILKDGNPTNAGILLFGKNPQRFFRQTETRCAKFKGTKAQKPFLDMKVLEGTISQQIDRAEKFVLDNMKKEAWIEPGDVDRKEKWEYPPDAVREAIVNAICHRDYQTTSNVQIRMFDDRIEIWNPGKLPEPLTPESLKEKHESIPKNPLIARMFFLVKKIEQWGTGTNEMVDMCLEHGLPEPEFEETDASFVVTIRKKILTEEKMEELGLNERQKKAFKRIEEKESITRSEYEDMFGISERTANRELSQLVDLNLIEKKGKGPNTHYNKTKISPNLAKSRKEDGL